MWFDMLEMFWRRMVPAVVAVVGLAVIGGPAERQIAVAHSVVLAAAIDESSSSVGLADSNLPRLGDKAVIDKQLDMMQSIGVKNVRIGVSWATLQLTDGGLFNWGLTNYDYVVDEALKRGMGVLAVLNETPVWAGDKVLSGMPDDVTKYGDFAAEVASHFEGRISDYEVWNEPNATFFLDPVSPENYTSLLKEAYARIKSVDAGITVIGGVLGFGFTLKDNDGNFVTMNPIEFLAGMYAAGAHGSFDALSFHPYKPDIRFSDQSGPLTPRGQLEELRKLMVAAGDGNLKIWATEYGLPTAPGEISPAQQADFIKDFLSNWGKVDGTGPMFIYSTRDLETGSDGEQDNYGIWETDWTEKQAVDVIRDFIAGQSGNPIIDCIRNAIVSLAKITGAVINGIVDVTVGIVTALVNATVWVVETIAKVAGAVVHGIAEVTRRVAAAICDTVHAVVDRLQDIVDRDAPAPALTTPARAGSLRTAAAELTPSAAEVGVGTVTRDDESVTATAGLNDVVESTIGGDPSEDVTEVIDGTEVTATTSAATDTADITTGMTPAPQTAATETTEPAATMTETDLTRQDEDAAPAGTTETDTGVTPASATHDSGDSARQEPSPSSSARAD